MDKSADHRQSADLEQRYAARVKSRLAKPEITLTDARDGVLDCFVATYFQGVNKGLQGMLAIDGDEDKVVRVTAGMFRNKLQRHGATFEAPTVEALRAVKEEVDDELHFRELPGELKGLHDQVCSLLLTKAEGDLPHDGDRSVVRRRASTMSRARTEPSSVPTRPRLGTVKPPAPDAGTAATVPVGGASPAKDDAVTAGLRGALAAFLRDFADGAESGDPVPALTHRMARLATLLDTLAQFENSRPADG